MNDVITSLVSKLPSTAKVNSIEKLNFSKDDKKPSGFKRSKTMGKSIPLLGKDSDSNKKLSKEGDEVEIYDIPSTPIIKTKKTIKKQLNTTSKKDKKKEKNKKKVSFHKDLIEFVDISKRNSLSNYSAAEIKTKKKNSLESNSKNNADDKLSNKNKTREKSPQHSCCCVIY